MQKRGKYKVSALVMLMLISLSASGKDYTEYHKSIIKAERQIFISHQVDSGLNTYLQVFKEFDFVFLHDCITAMQIALYNNNEKAFLFFIDKATQNGLLSRHLSEAGMVKTHPLYQKNKDLISKLYTNNRIRYLKRLDTVVIKRLYTLYEYDQSKKNNLKPEYGQESVMSSRQRYAPIVADIVQQLKVLIAEKGWISDKLAGIDQEDIFKEMKLQGLDLMPYLNKYKKTNDCVMGAYDLNEQVFASTLIMPILIHNNTDNGTGNLYDTSFYLQQITKGNMHPKDMAMIRGSRFFSHVKPDAVGGLPMFGIMGMGSMNTEPSPADSIINNNRKKIYLAPIEQDRAKWLFMKKMKMNYEFGYWGCRS